MKIYRLFVTLLFVSLATAGYSSDNTTYVIPDKKTSIAYAPYIQEKVLEKKKAIENGTIPVPYHEFISIDLDENILRVELIINEYEEKAIYKG